MSLSVCMIVRDEADTIEAALKCAWMIADEIVAIDTGSVDNTRALCKKLGARVFCQEWDYDFSRARNESLKYATKKWVMWLDADDRIDNYSANEILQLKQLENYDSYYAFKLLNKEYVNLDIVGYESCSQARMFPNYRNIYFSGRIHEQFAHNAVNIGLKCIDRSDVVINHIGYGDEKKFNEKIKRNNFITLVEIGFSKTNTEYFKYGKYDCYLDMNLLVVFDRNKVIGLSETDKKAWTIKAQKIIERHTTQEVIVERNNDLDKLNAEIERICQCQQRR
jgi:glycosyltransferase involved in cell wall biosynthesis